MAIQHTPRKTRTQAREPDSEEPTEQTSTQAEVLRAAMDEIRQLREERGLQQQRFEAALQQRDEELRRLQNTQLSLSENGTSDTRVCGISDFRARAGFKLKPDTFDGKVPLREFLSQFLLIARANNWDESIKTVTLAASLRGRARTVLENLENFDDLSFSEIKSKLELLFGEGTQNYYSLFTNKKQKFGEDLASFGAEIERLSRLAYPECPFAVRDKIACAQFISALSDGFLRRTLQLEGITSLNLAVERAKTVKIIQGENFEGKRENFRKINSAKYRKVERNDARKDGDGENDGSARQENERRKNPTGGKWRGNFSSSRGKECWTCGKTGHFRSECPEEKGNAV